MKYVSTSGKGTALSFREAVLGNLPNDGGLFFPTSVPRLDHDFIKRVPELSLAQIGSEVLKSLTGDDLPINDLKRICERVFHFPIPVVQVEAGIHSLELFHGPTYAFKDVGAKFLAECLAYFSGQSGEERTVLVATSGDTGGAVANGFLGVEGVRVVILYPKGKVSDLQEKQLTTLGKNITALEVDGTFDDCQRMVKSASADSDINNRMHLSSANSINIARWLAQSIYYYAPLQQGMEFPVISVPSGNYGNLTAGLLAKKMGVPIAGFIAASNANDVVPRYLATGQYEPTETVATLANAMDVADPSNFVRLLTLYDGDYDRIVKDLSSFSMDDTAILETIRTCQSKSEYLLDPHSAIAYAALKQAKQEGVFLSTAHYCKFLPTMSDALGATVSAPAFAEDLLRRKKVAIEMSASPGSLKEFLLS